MGCRIFCLLIVWVLLFHGLQAQVCGSGDITLTTQVEVDNFAAVYGGCDEVDGRLLIEGRDITDISPLISILHITGDLVIKHTSITDLEPFSTNLIVEVQ